MTWSPICFHGKRLQALPVEPTFGMILCTHDLIGASPEARPIVASTAGELSDRISVCLRLSVA